MSQILSGIDYLNHHKQLWQSRACILNSSVDHKAYLSALSMQETNICQMDEIKKKESNFLKV